MRKIFPLAIVIAFLVPPTSAQTLPAGKGRETFQTICTACHDVETTTNLRNTHSGWVAVIRDMKSNGADGTEAQFAEVIDYLTLNFGKKADDSAKATGPAPPAAPAAYTPLRSVPWEKNRLKIGLAIYRENCVVCHDVEREASQKIGPSFYHLFQREKMPKSNAKPDRAYIAGKVRVGGTLMPAFGKKLTSAEIDALLDYMQVK